MVLFFFTINIREQYENIISEYKKSNKEIWSYFREMKKEYKEELKNKTEVYESKLPDNYRKQTEETTLYS